MNNIFNALLKETQFTKEILNSGVTQIRNCNYSRKGAYFQSFTSLSTGLERIGKLCVMLDFYIDNSGSFPNLDYMKHEIGHDIKKLYEKSVSISSKGKVSYRFPADLTDEIHANILTVLSAFAKGDRYSNIDVLVHNSKSGDPLRDWYNTVDLPIFDKCVSEAEKAKIAHEARITHILLCSSMVVRYTSETGSEIIDIEESSYRVGQQEAVGPFRQLFILQIIRFWVELLSSLQDEAMGIRDEEIPYMSEILGSFYNSDEYLKTKEIWD